jgi:hypothetical protein
MTESAMREWLVAVNFHRRAVKQKQRERRMKSPNRLASQ